MPFSRFAIATALYVIANLYYHDLRRVTCNIVNDRRMLVRAGDLSALEYLGEIVCDIQEQQRLALL